MKRWKSWVMALLLVLPVSGVMAQSVSDDIQQLLLDVEKLSQLKQILTEIAYQEYTMLYNGYERDQRFKPRNVLVA